MYALLLSSWISGGKFVLTVADVMTRRPVLTGPDAPVTEALAAMRDRGISSVLVSPPAGTIKYGILTMRDVIGKIVKFSLDPDAVKVGEITSWRLFTASPSWTLREAAHHMAQARVRRLPVVQDLNLVGLVSYTDLFTGLALQHEWEHARAVRKERAARRTAQTGAAASVRDVMSSPAITIRGDATVGEAVEKMAGAGISSLLIPADGEPVAGIITKRDVIVKVLASGQDPAAVTVEATMSSPVVTIGPEATIEECSSRMSAEDVRRFPVQDGDRIVGIISDSDILAAVAGHRWWGRPGRRWPASQIVADVMQPVPPDHDLDVTNGVLPELSVWECAARLAHAPARRLPVVQEGRTIGVVSEADILHALEERGGAD